MNIENEINIPLILKTYKPKKGMYFYIDFEDLQSDRPIEMIGEINNMSVLEVASSLLGFMEDIDPKIRVTILTAVMATTFERNPHLLKNKDEQG